MFAMIPNYFIVYYYFFIKVINLFILLCSMNALLLHYFNCIIANTFSY